MNQWDGDKISAFTRAPTDKFSIDQERDIGAQVDAPLF